ncbi:MAG: GFA family protein [Nitrosomonadales bacterium]|nr:GFA family protein [Nitrosomonadales bacterium]
MNYQGSCHCGHIKFDVEGDLHSVKECNCSICSKRGALWWFVPLAQARFSTPESNLSTYQFGKKQIKHHFCSVCGCAPLGTGTFNGTAMAAINVRCLDNVDLSALKVKQVDGRSL